MMQLVDTSAWIDYLRGTPGSLSDAVEALYLAGEAALCDMVAL